MLSPCHTVSPVNVWGVGHRPLGFAAPGVTAHSWRRDLKDVGDQALIRGLDTAFPCMRPEADPILQRASADAGHKACDGYSCLGPAPACTREL